MCGGGVLSYLVIIPLIKFFGEHIAGPVAPGKMAISAMEPDDVRQAYVLYIGSGAVAAGGIISLIRSLPTIWRGLKEGLRDVGMFKSEAAPDGPVPRTDRDLSMKFVGIGIIGLMGAVVAAPTLLDAGIGAKILGAILIVVFGFLFVTVSSRLTGEIDSSSNPISGMTIATLLLTCLIFLIVGWTGSAYYVTALSVGAIVCIASSNGGSTSQDLKTGFLLGATPKYLQIAILFGSFASAIVLGPMLLALNDFKNTYIPVSSLAPQGNHVRPLHAGQDQDRKAASDRRPMTTREPMSSGTNSIRREERRKNIWSIPTGMRWWLRSIPASTGPTRSGRTGHRSRSSLTAPKATLIAYIISGILGAASCPGPWSSSAS